MIPPSLSMRSRVHRGITVLELYKNFLRQPQDPQDATPPPRTVKIYQIYKPRAREDHQPTSSPPPPPRYHGAWRIRHYHGVDFCGRKGHRRPRGEAGGCPSTASNTSRAYHQDLTRAQKIVDEEQAAAEYAKLIRSKKSRGIMVCSDFQYVFE
jgi:hypothetical protein